MFGCRVKKRFEKESLLELKKRSVMPWVIAGWLKEGEVDLGWIWTDEIGVFEVGHEKVKSLMLWESLFVQTKPSTVMWEMIRLGGC